MKQTIFYCGHGDEEQVLKLDFIYEPPVTHKDKSVYVLINKKEYYIFRMIDEFTKNPEVQIRHIRIMENTPPTEKHFL